jgi:hypothetical protein
MSLPHRAGDAHRERWPAPLPPSGGSTEAQSKLVGFEGVGTQWEQQILAFLREHPGSSLLPIVRHLWPDFLAFPAERRAQSWFWVKEQLQVLVKAEVLRCRECADGVATWSLV